MRGDDSVAGYMDAAKDVIPVLLGCLGIVIAVAAGVSSLCQYQENWIKYRTTAESLKKEQYFFLSKVQP